MQLAELSWTEVRDRDDSVAVLPVGSTEQHGPHNPVGVDTIVAESLARSASEELDVLCLPSISIGIAEHHRNFDGTLYVSHDVLRDYVSETLASVTDHGIDRVVVVNGHGGNSAALEEAVQRLSRDGDLYAVLWEWFDVVSADVGHGDEHETSLMLYLEPELVGEPVEGGAKTWGKTVHGASVAHDTHEFTENGVTGDPREASEELGERLFEEALNELTGLLEWMEERDLDAEREVDG